MTDTQATLQFLVASLGFGLMGWPLSRYFFQNFPDEGWCFSRAAGILVVGWISWMLNSFGLLPFSQTLIAVVLPAVGLLCWGLIAPKIRTEKTPHLLKLILVEEIIFVVAFCVWTFVRGYAPDINGLEKFMNYGFMVSISKATAMPPLDHFLARETINYYYFGHYLATTVISLARVPLTMGYNLQMSHLMALTLLQTFGLATAIAFTSASAKTSSEANRPRRQGLWLSCATGILAMTFVGLVGNFHTFFYKVIAPSKSYWYAGATRFIVGTIHEYPIYSFLINDLHAHVSSLPINLLTLGLLFLLFESCALKPLATPQQPAEESFSFLLSHKVLATGCALAFCIGMAYTVNSWDYAIYLLLSGVTFWTAMALRNPQNRGILRSFLSWPTLLIVAVFSIWLLALSILFFYPFWRKFTPLYTAVELVPFSMHSPLWQLAIIWGTQIAPVSIFLYLTVIRGRLGAVDSLASRLYHRIFRKSETPTIRFERKNKAVSERSENNPWVTCFLFLLCGMAILMAVVPEVIYLKDIYTTQPRANTMFKFYFQAWIWLGFISAFGITWSLPIAWRRSRPLAAVVTLLFLFNLWAASFFTFFGCNQAFGAFRQARRSIDGLNYLKKIRPNDYEAIAAMNRMIKGQPTIAEAVGASYSEFGRISAFTGFPAVLGWPVHEWLWRGSYDRPIRPMTAVEMRINLPDTVSTREADVRLLYETDRADTARGIIEKYEINYVYIGDLERSRYTKLNEEKFRAISKALIYDKDNVRIYQTR